MQATNIKATDKPVAAILTKGSCFDMVGDHSSGGGVQLTIPFYLLPGLTLNVY